MTKIPFYFEKCNPQTANRIRQDGKRTSQDSSLKSSDVFLHLFLLTQEMIKWRSLTEMSLTGTY